MPLAICDCIAGMSFVALMACRVVRPTSPVSRLCPHAPSPCPLPLPSSQEHRIARFALFMPLNAKNEPNPMLTNLSVISPGSAKSDLLHFFPFKHNLASFSPAGRMAAGS